MLEVNQTLQELDLSDNYLGDEGIKHIAEALKKNRALQILSLYCVKGSTPPHTLSFFLEGNGSTSAADTFLLSPSQQTPNNSGKQEENGNNNDSPKGMRP